ncbi:hypothetical protein SAMN02745938_101192 [Flavobacterium psychrophilum DSM 3660]|uniref:Uncharacterized protein n=1 Tax=Flavobacterium psychrophilum (strain ATCC 49511 / DSM 21280 / CIP 103535 / JIP02/86) TaxID=402612 RepID=A6H0F3_FLAPJ|nr:hypothetical protein [Flavobacterium psychrophilum]QGS64196.1 hypothetical protein GMY06_10315 [Flavobacterium psychrophilum]CAL43826.1 Hypothetical protein FP1759 [Flavobacterium psychrophilum JIP02/86]SCX77386.1 hypothetical protein SAMN02745938_101192 [Flavobacterium psychrophilum DSM 3660] [Flavobacterium psychrophilum DSM 3660 = ATCC 49418]SHH88781.1 Hypothetical protein THC0290_0948 [Flavobacterium psychrophilum]
MIHLFVQIIFIMVIANILDFRKDIKSYFETLFIIAKNIQEL